MLAGRTKATACTLTSYSCDTTSRIPAITSFQFRSPCFPATSWTTASPSSPSTSMLKAALRPGRRHGWLRSAVLSMSCGYRLRPRIIIRSLSRPVMNSSSSKHWLEVSLFFPNSPRRAQLFQLSRILSHFEAYLITPVLNKYEHAIKSLAFHVYLVSKRKFS
jgi:hypothetical protein